MDFWKTKEGLALIAGWRRRGESLPQIAKRMGIDESELDELCALDEVIARVLRIDKDTADFLVEEAVFRKSIAGDQKALEFWLKHRMPEKWGKDTTTKPTADYQSLAALINNPRERG